MFFFDTLVRPRVQKLYKSIIHPSSCMARQQSDSLEWVGLPVQTTGVDSLGFMVKVIKLYLNYIKRAFYSDKINDTQHKEDTLKGFISSFSSPKTRLDVNNDKTLI